MSGRISALAFGGFLLCCAAVRGEDPLPAPPAETAPASEAKVDQVDKIKTIKTIKTIETTETTETTGLPAAAAASPGSDIKRDPFRPFTVEVKVRRTDVARTPLEQYELSALELVAVIMGRPNRAMVEDAKGLGFTVEVGTAIGRNGGVVRRIASDRVVVEEEYVDFYNEKKKSEIVLKLERETEGEKAP